MVIKLDVALRGLRPQPECRPTPTTYGHGPAGRPTSTVDPRGNVVGADPAAYRTTYTYDDADHLLTETDPLGRVTRHEYDAAGNRWKTTDAAGNVTTFTYNAANELIEETLPGGAKQTYAYDSRGLLERVTTPLGFSTTYTYDDAGRMATMVDPRGNVAGADPAAFRWTYGYDPNGNRASVRDPLGKTTSYEYDVLDRLTVVTDPLGHATRYESDANNNQTKLTDANGGITSSVYDPLDRLTSVTDPRGKVTTFGYPNANRTRTTTPLGNATTFVYDADNRMTSTVEPRGNVTGANPDDYRTSFEYDPAGNRVAEIDALGNRTADTFDAVSNRTSRLDANANRTGYGFDELNRLRSVTAPDGALTSYTYDAPGNLVTRTDPKGHVTTYGYDADRRLTSLTSPIGQRWSYEYDPAGNRTKVVDAAGKATPAAGDGTTAYTLDALDRLRGINYSDATPEVSFDYDDASRRTSMTDGAGSETYGYDPLDRLTSVTRASSSFSYGYDPSGHVTRRTYPDGTSVDFTHDDDGRMDSVVTGGATTAYGYDPDANLTQITLPAANGYAETRSYDRSGRLTGIRTAKGASVLSDRTYALDRAGNPLSVKDATLAPAPATTRVSVSSSGQQGNGASGNPYLSMSGDGRYVVFASSATNLVSGDTNGVDDIFLRDRQTGATTRVSVSSSGAQSNGVSDDPKVSADGRYVAFHSSATNLVSGDTNAQPDIFVRDTVAGTTTRVSTTASGGQATRESHDPAISYDGKAVAFSSAATNLVSGDTNGVNDIFVKTLASGAITRVSVSSSGAQAAKASTGPAISADGRFVAFRSTATNLVTGDTNGFADIFLRDTTTATTAMVSVSSSGALANGDSSGVTISGDGRYVGFRSNATNLVSGDTNAVDDIFLRDTALSSTTRVSASSTGAQGNGTSSEPNLSADGRTIAFQSASSNLITGDTNGAADIFVRDPAGVVTRVSISSTGAQNPNASAGPFISADGRSVAFSTIGVLVPEDSNGTKDVFVANRAYDTEATYTYDTQDRLADVCFAGGCRQGTDPFVRYSYDAVGNRTTEARLAGTTTYSYNDANQLTSTTGPSGTTTYGYDPNGNETSAGGRAFTFDLANRLSTTTDAGATTSYAYDGGGRRISASSPSGTTNATWDLNSPLPQLALEKDGAGAMLRRYAYGLDLVSMTTPSGSFYYHHDRIGSVRNLTSSSGATEWSYAYEPFGTARSEVKVDPAAPANPMRFAGEALDDTGLYHLRARQHDPKTGRFLSLDLPKRSPTRT
ncbi:MAG: RHS repeat-associated core domain-containing protein [Actinomycetota bacterium]